MKNILIIAPHPDDEVLGCGGVMDKYAKEGKSVYALIMTRGDAKLYSDERIAKGRAQAKESHAVLGVKETFFFDYPAPNLDITSRAEMSVAISGLIKKLSIDTLFIPHRGDIHHDHYAVFNAAIVAGRPVGDYTVKRIYAYETLSETEWAAPFGDDAFIPTHFINIEDNLSAKLKAMECYSGQLRVFPNPRSLETLEALAKFRGATVGFQRAEAFMVIRTIED
ncbi:MAG: PIG-L family deacetylase [Bacteroidales bacterium]|nr:PIG-L family deacetylase [Bacteroidales bacterium]